MSSTPSSSAMPPRTLNLTHFELSIAQRVRKNPDATWSCGVCNASFDNNMRLTTHLLTLCDQPPASHTFSCLSAIRICEYANFPGPYPMLEAYIRINGNEREIEGSSSDSEAYLPLRDRDFPATPPNGLSAAERSEWRFRRSRAEEIGRVKKANRPHGRVDRVTALAAWNSSVHPKSWRPSDGNAQPFASYGSFSNRESLDREALKRLVDSARRVRRAARLLGPPQ